MPWWEKAASKAPPADQKRFNGIVIYTLWNLWKERNMHIFNNSEAVWQVAARIKDDIEQRKGVLR